MKVRNSTIRFISRSFILGTSQSGCPIPFFSTSVAATLQDWEMNAQAILPPQWWWDKTCVEEREETDTVGKKGERGYRSALSFHVFAAALPFLNKTVLTLYQSVHFTGTPCLDFFLCTAHGHYQGARRRGFWLGCTSRHIETVLWALSWQNLEINCAKPSLGLSSTPPCSNSSTCKPLDQCLKLLLGLSYLRISVSN